MIPPATPWPLQILVAPQSFLDSFVLADGEIALGGIRDTDRSVFTMFWAGGHDGANKLVGGGVQCISYSGPPHFPAPVGALVGQPSDCSLWMSVSYADQTGTGTGTGSGTGTSGSWCQIGSQGGITEIDTQSPILGGPITAGETGTISHAISGVTPSSYTNANISVDQWGHVTAASDGTSSGAPARAVHVLPDDGHVPASYNGGLVYMSSGLSAANLPTGQANGWQVTLLNISGDMVVVSADADIFGQTTPSDFYNLDANTSAVFWTDGSVWYVT